ncbi:glycosyltransferase family 4 protein [Candidatus Thiodictyon syntrophicum]|jgi:glycosyltransferase involved in cell wall biosynthesis|uniref:Glycosyl transferase family 1 n=1 Tax=Candidatus Thiodictyon syntrophicum TaxID=1166950 RepID=A0A2K8U511_9GAMM|nr:glycosyltransferase family 4 protein [Candidatus Thiodictyon syntrophicum]AUB80680.1 hypothetical protein THSYN_06755 [Candidatus Thiodictyon syntrophicum]
MKTLWLIPSFWPTRGGIETAGLLLGKGLQAKGHELLIVTDEGDPAAAAEETVAGLPVIRLPVYRALVAASPAALLRVAQRLTALAAAFRPDLVHLHLVGPAPMGLFALRLRETLGVPLLLTVHDDVQGLRAGASTVLGRCFEAADWVTTLSQTFMTDVLGLAPHLTERASIIYPGLVGAARELRSLRAPVPEFLCLGRVSHEKGLDLVLTAFAKVVQTHATTRLIIAGDGPARHLLERQAWELEVSERVTFTGTVSDEERAELFGRALAVVMPSRHREGFGLVALEAAQHGRAVIAARAGALSEAVSLLGNGLLIAQEDAGALSAAMTQLLLHPDDAQRMGAAGQAQAALLFSQEACAAKYSALYVKLRQTPAIDAHSG